MTNDTDGAALLREALDKIPLKFDPRDAKRWWAENMAGQFISARMGGDGYVKFEWRDDGESGSYSVPWTKMAIWLAALPIPEAPASVEPVDKGPCAICGGGEGYGQHGPFKDDWHKYQPPSPSFGGEDFREALEKARKAMTFTTEFTAWVPGRDGLNLALEAVNSALAALPPVKQSVGEGLINQSRKVRNYSDPNDVFEAVPTRFIVEAGERALSHDQRGGSGE